VNNINEHGGAQLSRQKLHLKDLGGGELLGFQFTKEEEKGFKRLIRKERVLGLVEEKGVTGNVKEAGSGGGIMQPIRQIPRTPQRLGKKVE